MAIVITSFPPTIISPCTAPTDTIQQHKFSHMRVPWGQSLSNVCNTCLSWCIEDWNSAYSDPQCSWENVGGGDKMGDAPSSLVDS